MQHVNGDLIVSASDLNDYLACRHLTALNLAYARGDRSVEPRRGPEVELIARKGDEHEAAYLQSLKDEGRQVVEIAMPDRTTEALHEAAAATEEAMRDGAEVIYQGTFYRGGLRGHADFLFRVDRASELGSWSYEVADTKLARRAKPYFVLQLCFYSELLHAVQGGEPPERIHVILGTNEQPSFRLVEFAAYFRRIRDRFLAELRQDDWDTYPIPVEHCAVCRWRDACDARWLADDHLSLVANIRRDQVEVLEEAGIRTLAALGETPSSGAVPGLRAEMLAKLRDQAALQLVGREADRPVYRLLELEDSRGFTRLPEPSEGDVFFDMEGDPFFEDGLEYLFGVVTVDSGEPMFEPIWARDRAEERLAFESFIDLVTDRRRQYPNLHVYHYAHYEPTALRKLAGRHATREEELDELLRDQVFVDLFKVVREGLRISEPSYGLKKVEGFYMPRRDTTVTDANDSVVEFERWLESGDDAILDEIADYNRDDCESTWRLREWLFERRSEVERELGVEIEWFTPEKKERSEEALAELEENEALMARLLDGVPEEAKLRSEEERARWLMAQLIEYHHREARPVYWLMFDRFEADPEQLVDDADCVGGMRPDPETAPWPVKRSTAHRLLFEPQETKVKPGDRELKDPATRAAAGALLAIEPERGWLDLKRGPTLDGCPLPEALVPGGPYITKQQRDALRRLARDIADNGAGADAAYPASRQILRRARPRVGGRAEGEPVDHEDMDIEELKELVAALDRSYLFIQGPPGSGKTWSGARLIVDLIERGNRVGVTSNSHKAIHALLKKVEDVADAKEVDFRGLKKCSADNPESAFESARIKSVDDNAALTDPGVKLAAGTAWHHCRPEVDGTLDYLFIDEAGQVSLADALALSTAAANVVLLGDPQQLPQVTQGTHPEGSSLSVLEHLLGDHQTIPPDRGVFLDRTWRLHPEVCAFVSELMYDGRLYSAEGCERQRVIADGELSGTGLRWLPVEHRGHSQESPEEAERIAGAVEPLLEGARYTDSDGAEHPLRPTDILVITPYNAQVRCLEQRLSDGVRVGTVDKIQGQEAQVVLYSMATSSGDDLPRNLGFLFSRNRLNVAISRARCLAAVVASPRLLDIGCRSIEEMRLVNALCRFAEVAPPLRD
jgi:predicted RecB family nuclease